MTSRININDNWKFTKNPCSFNELDNQMYKNVDIPHTWNGIDGQNGGDNYHRGLCWYLKEVNLKKKDDKKYFIEFEAVNSVANVYLNGVHLGEHRGGYSTFRFEITDLLTDGKNTIAVGADNSEFDDVYPQMADFTFYGGIYRDVNIIETEKVHFELMDYASSGVYVSQRNVTKEYAEIEVTALLNSSGAQEELVCNASLADKEGKVVANGSQGVLVKDTGKAVVLLTLDSPILWNGVKNPYLYSCNVELVTDGKVTDSISIPTGLRFFEFCGDKGFILNGERCKLKGVSRHQDREDVGNALTKEHQIEDMKLIKEIGANSIRLAHYQHNQFFYDLCDKEGMVIWAEIPYISKTAPVEDYAANAESQMKELVKQNYNHSSILMWGVQNEIGIMAGERPLTEVVGNMNKVVKDMDTTRVTTQAQVMMIKEDDPSNWKTDIVAFNQYHGWYLGNTSGYDKFINDFRKANPHKSLGYSEYGAEGIVKWHADEPKVKDYTEEYHAKFHEEVLATFNKYDFLWGSYVWNMFDFGSDMRDEGGIKGRNNKGLVTFDRTIKKDAFFFYKASWSDEPTLHIASKRFADRHLDTIKVKVYSNLGEVTLYCNGKEIETKKSSGVVYEFVVALKKGKNTMSAMAKGLEDTAVFKKVRKPNDKYVLPASERDKGISLDFLDDNSDSNVTNWFDGAASDQGEVPELNIMDGYFSVKDKLKDIMASTEGEEFMRKHMKPLVENSLFKMMKNASLKDLQSFKPDAFPDRLLYNINEGLNKIKK